MLSSEVAKIGPDTGVAFRRGRVVFFDTRGHSAQRLFVIEEAEMQALITWWWDRIEDLCPNCNGSKPHPPPPMFYVVEWATGKITHRCKSLKQAKGWARGAGHTGVDDPLLTGYPPVSHVQNEAGECVYNPRFGKRFSSALGGLIDAQPPEHF